MSPAAAGRPTGSRHLREDCAGTRQFFSQDETLKVRTGIWRTLTRGVFQAGWTITPAMLGLSAGIALVCFAFPLSLATQLYQPASLFFIQGLPHGEFAGSVVLSLVSALAVVLALCLASVRAGVTARTVERIAALILGGAYIAGPAMMPSPLLQFASWEVAILGTAACVFETRFGNVARAVAARVSLVIALGCVALLGYEVAAATTSCRSAATLRFLDIAPSSRVIVILLFDELDEELAFRLRPKRVEVPNLMKFESEALHATHVSPVGNRTEKAIPSLLTGRIVARAVPRSPHRLDLYGPDGGQVAWEARDTVFAKLRSRGFNSAILGWHHPYCLLFAAEVAACETFPNIDSTDASRVAFYFGQKGVTLLKPLTNVAEAGIGGQYQVVAQEQYRQSQTGLRTLDRWIADRRLRFIWAHVPYPHPPGIAPARVRHKGTNYFDNLTLVDDAVRTVVAGLKRAGRWDDSIVVVTGDHGLRPELWRDRPLWTREEEELAGLRRRIHVPLMVHLPHQASGVSVSEPINALVLHELILEWSQGRLTKPEELAQWLRSRSRSDQN